MRLFYCDQYGFPLPEGHKFPLAKYGLVREVLKADQRFTFEPAPLAQRCDLLRVHTEEYVDGFLSGTVDPKVMRRIGFPWSRELVTRTLASVGGSLAATRAALNSGSAGTLAGGTHHAFRGEGAGFCVFNDLAVVTEWARQSAGLERIAIVDLDVHQGDGTAQIFHGDDGVFTLSLHGAQNFPARKQQSRLDVPFRDGVTAGEYLPALREALEQIWSFQPELVLFQSGVDALTGDRLGRMSLRLEDLAERDRMVLEGTRERAIPIAILMGGGYSDPVSATVKAHAQTYLLATEIYDCEIANAAGRALARGVQNS